MLQILEYLASTISIVIFYQIFISDKIQVWWNGRAESTSADKIARLKMLSDDSKDIEKFIIANAATLSNESMNQLLARLETLHADKVLNDDTRFRVNPNSPLESEDGALFAKAVTRSGR